MDCAFDIETDGFLDTLTRVHSLVVFNLDTGELVSCADQPGYRPIEVGLKMLQEADTVVGHNILRFDLPALKKVYPLLEIKGVVRDTVLLARYHWPDVKDDDIRRVERGFPRRLVGKNTLEAWGVRLGVLKGSFGKGEDDAWQTWTPEMQTYCEQDVRVTVALWQAIKKAEAVNRKLGMDDRAAIELEHRFAELMAWQEAVGVVFDKERAAAFYAELAGRRAELLTELQKDIPPWWAFDGQFTPSRDNKRTGYTAGAPFSRVKLKTFSPSSRTDVADRLMKLYGWKPADFTDTGRPQINDEILAQLDYPIAPKLLEYYMIEKVLGYIAEGDASWLKLVGQDGRIHGAVVTLGTATRRCSHQSPNLAQVPTGNTRSPHAWAKELAGRLGKQCRSLFVAPEGYVMVGTDASGLELRCLAHYMARYDGGRYADILLNGDIHWETTLALGFVPQGTVRDKNNKSHEQARNTAKRFIYAFLYGAGDEKIGTIAGIGPDEVRDAKADKRRWRRAIEQLKRQGRPEDPLAAAAIVKGAELRAAFLAKTPGLKRLKEDLEAAVRARNNKLKAIDGGALHVRSMHSALNTLLQSAGAIVMKKAVVMLDDKLRSLGWKRDEDYAFALNIHDEYQCYVRSERAEEYAKLAPAAITEAGQALGFRCRLDGEARIGRNWAETH